MNNMTKYKIIPESMSFECSNELQEDFALCVDLRDKQNTVTVADFNALISKCKSIHPALKSMNIDFTVIDAIRIDDKPEKETDESSKTVYAVKYGVFVHGNTSVLEPLLKFVKKHGEDKNVETWKDENIKANWQKITDVYSANVAFTVKIVSDKEDDLVFDDISELDVKDIIHDFIV